MAIYQVSSHSIFRKTKTEMAKLSFEFDWKAIITGRCYFRCSSLTIRDLLEISLNWYLTKNIMRNKEHHMRWDRCFKLNRTLELFIFLESEPNPFPYKAEKAALEQELFRNWQPSAQMNLFPQSFRRRLVPDLNEKLKNKMKLSWNCPKNYQLK